VKSKLLENNENTIKNLLTKCEQYFSAKTSIEDKYIKTQYEVKNLQTVLESNEVTIVNLTDVNKDNEGKIRTLEDTIKKLENMLEPVRNISEEFKNLFNKTREDTVEQITTDSFVKSTNEWMTDDCHAIINL